MPLIIGSRSGRLANRLFSFSHFIANAIHFGYSIHNPNFVEYRDFFQTTQDDNFYGYPIKTQCGIYKIFRNSSNNPPYWMRLLKISPWHQVCVSDEFSDLNNPSLQNLIVNKIVIAYGWGFRDLENLSRYANQIRAIFQPTQKHRENVNLLIQACRQPAKSLAGIHIRRGDYKTWQGGKYYYDHKVYRDIILTIQDQFALQGKDVNFLLCSDESIPLEAFHGIKFQTGTGHPLEDLYALAACDLIVSPPSTYAGWASFYGNKPHVRIPDPRQIPKLDSSKVYGILE